MILAIVAGCFAWFVVSVYVVAFVQWIIGGDVDSVTGIIGIGVFLGMGFTMAKPPYPELQMLSIVGIYSSAVMFPILRWSFKRRDKKGADVEAVRKAYEGFVFRPDNAAAKIKLARHLWTLGLRGHAYVLAEHAIPDLPRQYFPDEHRMFAQWQAQPPSPREFEPLGCIECATPNPPGTVHCLSCGARFLLHRVEGRVLSKGLGRKLLSAWIVMMIAIGGMPLASRLPGTTSVIVVVALMVAALGALVLAFRPSQGTA